MHTLSSSSRERPVVSTSPPEGDLSFHLTGVSLLYRKLKKGKGVVFPQRLPYQRRRYLLLLALRAFREKLLQGLLEGDERFSDLGGEFALERLLVGHPCRIIVLVAQLEHAALGLHDAEENDIGQTLVSAFAPDDVAVGEDERMNGGHEKSRFFHHLTLEGVGEVLPFVELAAGTFPKAGVMRVGGASLHEQELALANDEASVYQHHLRAFRSGRRHDCLLSVPLLWLYLENYYLSKCMKREKAPSFQGALSR